MPASDNPLLTKAFALLFVGFMMPVLMVIVWRMALGIDPLNLTILIKGQGEITSDTPGELRIIGGIVIGLGLLVAGAAANAVRTGRAAWRPAALMALAGLEVACFGGGVFMTGDVAQDMIEQEQLP